MQSLELLEKPSQSFYTDIRLRARPKSRETRFMKEADAKRHSSALVASEPVASLQGRLSEKGKARTEPCFADPCYAPQTCIRYVRSTLVVITTGCFPVDHG